jgi:hypothetical protein
MVPEWSWALLFKGMATEDDLPISGPILWRALVLIRGTTNFTKAFSRSENLRMNIEKHF